MHRLQPDDAEARVAEADQSLRRAQQALAPLPEPGGGRLPPRRREGARRGPSDRGPRGRHAAARARASSSVGLAAWLNGLAEAASELRRHLLDRLRAGETARGEELLEAMEDVYDMLVTIEYPDAITGGLRRATDALRAVVERSRADVTTTVLQGGLQRAIEERLGPARIRARVKLGDLTTPALVVEAAHARAQPGHHGGARCPASACVRT